MMDQERSAPMCSSPVGLHVVYFSCGAHAEYLELSLRSLARVASGWLGSVYVGEDPDDPLPQSARDRLTSLYLPLHFRQWGKVTGYGAETVISELKAFRDVARELPDNHWLMKVDSDVLFLNNSILSGSCRWQGDLVGQRERYWGRDHRYAQGGVYFLRTGAAVIQQPPGGGHIHEVASRLLIHFNKISRDSGKHTMMQCPEDAVMDTLVRESGGAVVLRDFYLPLWQLNRMIKNGKGYALRRPSVGDCIRNHKSAAGVLWHDWKLRLGHYSVIHFQYCKERMSEIYEVIASS